LTLDFKNKMTRLLNTKLQVILKKFS